MKYLGRTTRPDGSTCFRIGPYHKIVVGDLITVGFLFFRWIQIGGKDGCEVFKVGPFVHLFDHRPVELR